MASEDELEVRKCLAQGAACEGTENWSAAESFYRRAVKLDAAWSFITATRLYPKNSRAWQYLEQLLCARPGLLGQNAELADTVAVMRRVLEEQACLQEPLGDSPMLRTIQLHLTQ